MNDDLGRRATSRSGLQVRPLSGVGSDHKVWSRYGIRRGLHADLPVEFSARSEAGPFGRAPSASGVGIQNVTLTLEGFVREGTLRGRADLDAC